MVLVRSALKLEPGSGYEVGPSVTRLPRLPLERVFPPGLPFPTTELGTLPGSSREGRALALSFWRARSCGLSIAVDRDYFIQR